MASCAGERHQGHAASAGPNNHVPQHVRKTIETIELPATVILGIRVSILHSHDNTQRTVVRAMLQAILRASCGLADLVGANRSALQLKCSARHAADGLAVGAAIHGGNAKLGAAVAFAMILHKVPAALGLTTFLISLHWSRRQAVKGLMAFAAAAPVAAIITAVLLGLVPFLSHPSGAALCVIFSGGTFLYAACVHVLPEARHAGPGGQLSR